MKTKILIIIALLFCVLSAHAQMTDIERQAVVDHIADNMVLVDGGTFLMGNASGYTSEKPVHQVTLSSYSICRFEVTEREWMAVMGSNPSSNRAGDLPVVNVSWEDCQTFISRLNQMTGKSYRLPTEAEWEFAARGGNRSHGYTYSGSNTISLVAWYSDNSGNKRHPVGTKNPNELGLYDMSGNVMEWCNDRMGDYPSSPQTNPVGNVPGSIRVGRGGGWSYDAGSCRASRRCSYSPVNRSIDLGLRLAL